MTISEMLGQSGILTLLGMGVVFSFLIIMILCMNLLRMAIQALHLDKDTEEKNVPQAASSPSVDEKAVVAAIVGALKSGNKI